MGKLTGKLKSYYDGLEETLHTGKIGSIDTNFALMEHLILTAYVNGTELFLKPCEGTTPPENEYIVGHFVNKDKFTATDGTTFTRFELNNGEPSAVWKTGRGSKQGFYIISPRKG